MTIHLPVLVEIRAYLHRDLRHDLVAGLTVGIVALPQSMAYALIAGVHPAYGLYTAIVTAIVASFLGSSNHLVTGPTNAIALMVAGTMKDSTGGGDTLATLLLLTFLVGAIQFLCGVLRAGRIVDYISHPVIVGFTAGAGIIIALGQLNQLLGISLAKGYHPLYEKVLLTLIALNRTNPYALALGLLTVALILICRKTSKYVPGALAGIVTSAVLVAVFGLADKGLALVGEIPGGLPPFRMVHFDLMRAFRLAGGAAAIALVGLVEAISIAKSVALSSRQRIEPNREFIGQGVANMVGAFFRCFPASGSFTRSAINYDAGARTRMACLISGCFVAIAIILFAPYARFIPQASLAGVIVVVAYNMVDKHAINRITSASRPDMAVMALTAFATIFLPDLELAILTGVIASVVMHLWRTRRTKVKLLIKEGKSRFREVDLAAGPGRAGLPGISVVHIEGDIYFGSASDLEQKLRRIGEDREVKVCILRLKRVNVVDVSGFAVVESFVRSSLQQGRKVLLCGLSETLKELLDKMGLTSLVGDDNVFLAEERIYASANKAYERAKSLLNAG